MFVQAEGGEDLPVNKDALYEEVRMPERHKICVSKVARIMESVQLIQAKAEALEFRVIGEESARKADEAAK